jgi:hypothetical protein
MTDELSIDYAWARPKPSAIAAAGYAAVWRYLSNDPSKNLTLAERDALLAAGLGIGLVWETTAQRSLSGAPGGVSDGRIAAGQAKALGMPKGAPLLVAIGDFAATGGELGVIHDYYYHWRQATSGYATGAYLTGYMANELYVRGARGLFWQNAMDDQGAKGSVVSKHAHLYQRVKHTRPVIKGSKVADYDENITVNGASVPWWRKVSAQRFIADGRSTIEELAARHGVSIAALIEASIANLSTANKARLMKSITPPSGQPYWIP